MKQLLVEPSLPMPDTRLDGFEPASFIRKATDSTEFSAVPPPAVPSLFNSCLCNCITASSPVRKTE